MNFDKNFELWDEIPEKNYMEKFFMKIPINKEYIE